MNSPLQPGSIPKPQTALFPRVFAQESPRFSTFVFNRFRILPSSVGCKSFACHSYENCRVSLGVTPAFVKKNFSYADVSTGRNNLSHRLGPKSSRAYWM